MACIDIGAGFSRLLALSTAGDLGSRPDPTVLDTSCRYRPATAHLGLVVTLCELTLQKIQHNGFLVMFAPSSPSSQALAITRADYGTGQ
jgi:hypothetical protein